jgi:hypothetical protein
MYRDMEQWSEIRRRVLVEGVSRRQILRETGMHWLTLRKILEHSQPPGYRQQKARPRQKLGPYLGRIEQILQEDRAMPHKQRHTARTVSLVQGDRGLEVEPVVNSLRERIF